jgi:hypothetical protein
MVSVRIPLTHGKFARVSIEDAERVRSHKWHACTAHSTIYAASRIGGVIVYMHRFLVGDIATDIDHRNRDGLHNYRSNLRAATRTQNNANARMRRDNTSGYRGVMRDCRTAARPWSAKIIVKGHPVWLGSHATAREAAQAYNEGAVRIFGEFAYTNDVGRNE